MTSFTRTDISMLGRWWWTVDRWTLAAVAMLVGFGILLTLAASPSVAVRLDLDAFQVLVDEDLVAGARRAHLPEVRLQLD